MMRAPEIAVTDTHALIWWITNQRRRLGKQANAFFDRVDDGQAVVCIPTLALVELDEAMASGSVSLGEPFPDFVRRLETTPSRYLVVSLTPEILLLAHELLGIPERSDRLIAATAASLGYPLITRDAEITRVIGADHIW
ncbi:MAG TPA: PIN domain-containing protein [Longimicrobium sp.]|nr:PIN domain-containing protein [Longimicrobium sp.]